MKASAGTLLIAFDPLDRLVPVELLFPYSVKEIGVDPHALIIVSAGRHVRFRVHSD